MRDLQYSSKHTKTHETIIKVSANMYDNGIL